MKKILQTLLLSSILPFSSFSQINPSCSNLDFETGFINGWNIKNGSTVISGNSCSMISCCTGTAPTYTILNNGYTDPYFPTSPLNSQFGPAGGNKFIRLNNSSPAGKEQRLSQSFSVTSSNALFKYAYRYVTANSNHVCCDAPFMNLHFLDASNNLQTLFQPNFSVTATSSCSSSYSAAYAGMAPCPTNTNSSYTNWIYGSADLTQFIGSYVTFELIVGDCSAAGHASYLYFDAECSSLTFSANSVSYPLDSTNTVCTSSLPMTLTAPGAMQSFTWNGPGVSNWNGSALSASSYGTYTLQIQSMGSCCPTMKLITVTPCTGVSTNGIVSSELYLYPNPAKNEIFIKNLDEDYDYEITDVFGKMVRSKTSASRSQSRINISDLSQGIYFVTIHSNNQTRNFRIVKE